MLAFSDSNNASALRHIFESEEYDKRYDLMNTAGETCVVAAMKGHVDVIQVLIEKSEWSRDARIHRHVAAAHADATWHHGSYSQWFISHVA